MTTAAKAEESEVARHIARAAARLFARRGYEATSIREIVEEAGVAKPTLYYYYGSKEGLAKALLADPLNALAERLGDVIRNEADPVRVLEQVLEAHFAFCREEPDRSRLFFAVGFGPPEAGLALMMECRKGDLHDWTAAAFGRCVEAGLLDPESVDAFATMFRGVLIVSIIDFLYHDKPLGGDRARVLVAALLRGFEGRRPPAGPEGRP
ncbi:TetR/AcrR family transcriptional regulator [Paludisphaera mucosa]|uniref:TetR/AcrR family transcriptional regulator n=1 Tax=Paludisphaera mucosa TaxID=3030827 RepID=A0ABT6FDT5_9BACT|nr:TetR/AcrR family transcriptional regulator [Paludisphaera mucosa]MDG3005714.1 TetR/AcrR family transcriptional regulator [Paludisphaera mucosa]